MGIKRTSTLAGCALLALTTAVLAGPTSVAPADIISASTSLEQIHWRKGWHYGRHYGWYRPRHHRYGQYYGYSAPVATGPMAGEGYYCATAIKTCLLSEPGWLGTGCSCRVPDGIARGMVE